MPDELEALQAQIRMKDRLLKEQGDMLLKFTFARVVRQIGDFDQDLTRLEQIRRAQRSSRPKQDNPAWMNSHADCDFLLGFIDKITNRK
jgi:hypothetical protein